MKCFSVTLNWIRVSFDEPVTRANRCFMEHDHRQSGVIEQDTSADIRGIKRSFTVSKQSNNQTPSLFLRSSTMSSPSTQFQEIVLKCIENKDTSSLKFLWIYQRLKEDKLVGEFVKKTETPFVHKLGRFTRQEYSNLIKKQMMIKWILSPICNILTDSCNKMFLYQIFTQSNQRHQGKEEREEDIPTRKQRPIKSNCLMRRL